MPRPTLTPTGKGGSRAPKSSNPFKNFLESRKQRRREVEEEAAKMITNSIAQNQTNIIDQLSSIDFLHSKLPKKVLETKTTSPDQTCGDLEYASNVIASMLIHDPQIIKMDIRKFDQKLMTLTLLFKQAVEQGDVRASYAAKGALVRGIMEIRSRIPQNQPELARQFVEANTSYLDSWITLVTLAQVADRTKQNVDNQRDRHAKAEKKDNECTSALKTQIMENNEFALAFDDLYKGNIDPVRTNWTPVQREVHRLMVERRMGKVNLELNALLLHQQEIDLSTKESQIELLNSKVASLPIVTDPNLMNKFQENIDQLFQNIAETDAMIDETLKVMDDIEGRIMQLDAAPGAVRAREVAAEEAEKALEEMKRLESIQSGQNAEKARKMRESMGLHTEEELAELKRQAEQEEQRVIEEMREQLQQQEEELELISN